MTPQAARAGVELEFEVRQAAVTSRRRVRGPVITIGRDRSATIAFPDDVTVSRHHAEITVGEAGCVIAERSNSLNHTYVNGTRLVEPRPLTRGDTISLGANGPQLRLMDIVAGQTATVPPPPAAAPPAPVATPRARDAGVVGARPRGAGPAAQPGAAAGTTVVRRLNAQLNQFVKGHRTFVRTLVAAGIVAVVGVAVGGKMLYDEVHKVRPTDWAAIGERLRPGLAYISVDEARSTSSGSGFLVDASGLVATNYHVIDGAKKVSVQFADADEEFASPGYVFADKSLDLAVIKVDLPASPPRTVFSLSEAQVRPLQPVAVFGSPQGLRHVLAQGTIQKVATLSSITQELRVKDSHRGDMLVIVHGADQGPGNSGGPLVDERGEVVGINSWTLDPKVEMANSNTGYVRTREFPMSVHVKHLREHLPDAKAPIRDYDTLPR